MDNPLRGLLSRSPTPTPREEDASIPPLADIRMVVGQLLIAAGAGATVDALAARVRPRKFDAEADLFDPFPGLKDRGPAWDRAADWAGIVTGPAAGAAQIAHALYPSTAARLLSRALAGAALTVGVVSLADTFRASLAGERPPSLPHLTFAGAGLMGLLVDRIEGRVEAAREAATHAPSRPPRRVDRIVIRA